MLLKESLWLNKTILNLELAPGNKVLNFGCQDKIVYKYQPHLYNNIIKPTIDSGAKIINYDLFPGKGVDISGDLFDDNVFNKLKEYNFRYIYLFNVLEHVEDKEKLCLRIEELLEKNGTILISVPHSYPIHYDPIDNGFRPTPKEIADLFPNCEIIDSKIVIDHNFLFYLMNNWRVSLKFVGRLFTPFYRYDRWRNTIVPKLNWLNKPYKIACIVLRKTK